MGTDRDIEVQPCAGVARVFPARARGRKQKKTQDTSRAAMGLKKSSSAPLDYLFDYFYPCTTSCTTTCVKDDSPPPYVLLFFVLKSDGRFGARKKKHMAKNPTSTPLK